MIFTKKILSPYLKLDVLVNMNQPIHVALGLVVAVFHQEAGKFVLGAIKTLPCELYAECLTSSLCLKELKQVPYLCIKKCL